jgi:hypothetical protein
MATMTGPAIPAPSDPRSDRDDTELARTSLQRVSRRLLPFLFLLYVCNFLDRTNVAIAALPSHTNTVLTDNGFQFN